MVRIGKKNIHDFFCGLGRNFLGQKCFVSQNKSLVIAHPLVLFETSSLMCFLKINGGWVSFIH